MTVWTRHGLITFYLLFAIHLKTRRVTFAGCTVSPDGVSMKQIARNLTDACDGFLIDKKYVFMDRDTKFTESFRATLKNSGAKPLLLPPLSPNLNAHIERFWQVLVQVLGPNDLFH